MDIVELEKGHPETEAIIKELAKECGNQTEIIRGAAVSDTIHFIGDTRKVSEKEGYVKELPGVAKIWNVSIPYKNIAKTAAGKNGEVVHRETRIVEVKGPDGLVRKFGTGKHIFIVGPDSPQTYEQTLTIAKQAVELGKKYNILDRIIFRGGAFKPRTRPTDWRGLGWEGIAMMDKVKAETGLPYVTEVMDHTMAEEVAKHADMIQIGTRNAQDFELLEAVGRTGKPVILKRGFGNEAVEWFSAAEYIANQGNLNIVLCERGVKTLFIKEGYCRNTPDLNVITHVKNQTILPVIYDPSHVAGDDKIVISNLLASLPFNPDGSITETLHVEEFRKEQMCDAAQALLMSIYEKAVQSILKYEEAIRPITDDVDSYFVKRKSGK
ncbi:MULTISPECIES: N-acetylneuraminate synthase family protein [Leptospira]|uniref:3-deoxy-D-arabino-heptulosonate 7-phosphate synthase n=3 Tax=Leptospira TaxID=171 RepID=A0A2M9YPZ6_9LEPT|nr:MULTISPECIES: N-acetylneuraminate synthase family protein [Leptospira]MBM9576828.1 N-acetylneuraminate synthase family protein [Leptospira ainlahdjerensis]PJZ53614.1 3-deoxy-D-arabino-heptulosonate 7-phosphate synthase [Leptospira adleri]PJZ60231.1 3-deoxy-D-arabino-heptulosonate 7-phosphate synthase [Leptospira adleri]RHX91870.1 3-deoxy-D-arabino-heptulosonate 7-phosphate synthase [Leptospira stimsonii]TGK10827.1 3-deoxy-D-arabino-heptulosonate 7-phosphate synthase [Leptospira stimsonii]